MARGYGIYAGRGRKSAFIFSVAAMTRQQRVIVVVPFAALVDDIIILGQAAGLYCEEWTSEKSGHELEQLIVVSADRVRGQFCIMPRARIRTVSPRVLPRMPCCHIIP